MAQKRINDLALRSSFDATCNFPSDDLVQTWRVTGAQVLTYVNANAVLGTANITDATITKAKLATGAKDLVTQSKTASYTVLNTDELILANATSGAIVLTLPTAASITGRVFSFTKTDSSANLVTIDGNGSETIGGSLTVAMGTINDCLRIVSDGTNWKVISKKISVAVRVTNTSSQVIPASGTQVTMVFDASKIIDTHGAMVAATGIFTCPVGLSGRYGVAINTATLTAINTYLMVKINGTVVDIFGTTAMSYNRGSGYYNLNEGDTLIVTLSKDAAGTATLTNAANYNMLSIVGPF